MNNILNIGACYGCGVCVVMCTRQIISLRQNDDGFYTPHIIAIERCTDCGLCLKTCSYSYTDLALKDLYVKSYAGWSNNDDVRRVCSSGGIGFELARRALEEGYKVCGVKYNVRNNRAEHYIATTIEELIPSIGSKYIQSYTVDAFRGINLKQKYFVTGTPCQIDSFRRYLKIFKKEDNFVLMDFFCHGVPSMLLWKKYVDWAEKQVGKLTYVSWRNKFTGWHDSWTMSIDGANKGEPMDGYDGYNSLMRGKKSALNSWLSQGDMFYRLFLSDACLNKACYARCKFKYDKSSADIRIGDCWGTTYQDEEKGVSAVIVFTSKGHELLKRCNCELKEHPFDVVAEYQMKKQVHRPTFNKKLMEMLRDKEIPIELIYTRSISFLRIRHLKGWLMNPKRTIRNFIRRII